MIALYQVKTPASVSGAQSTPGGQYGVGTTHQVRVYAYADIPGVGRVISEGYAESEVLTMDAEDSQILWTVVAAPAPYGNEPHYVNPTGYLFQKKDTQNCAYNFNAYAIPAGLTKTDLQCSGWTAGNPIGQWQTKLTFSTTPQADIPRQSALSTNAAIEALAFTFIAAFRAYAASGGQLLYGHGNPNGVYTGNVGWLYTDIDSGVIWTKTSGNNTNTGWTS